MTVLDWMKRPRNRSHEGALKGERAEGTCRVLELCQVEDPVGVGHGRALRGVT